MDKLKKEVKDYFYNSDWKNVLKEHIKWGWDIDKMAEDWQESFINAVSYGDIEDITESEAWDSTEYFKEILEKELRKIK